MKLDENRRQRLEFLADNLSVDYKGDDSIRALLDAIDKAAGEVLEHLKTVHEDVCAEDGKGKGAALMLEILQRDFDALDSQEARDIIISSLSKPYGFYSSGLFLDEVNERCVACSITNSEGTVTIENGAIVGLDALSEYCRLISDFVPPFYRCVSSGKGASFSKWDSLSASWYQLDKMDMPFYLIETFNIK